MDPPPPSENVSSVRLFDVGSRSWRVQHSPTTGEDGSGSPKISHSPQQTPEMAI